MQFDVSHCILNIHNYTTNIWKMQLYLYYFNFHMRVFMYLQAYKLRYMFHTPIVSNENIVIIYQNFNYFRNISNVYIIHIYASTYTCTRACVLNVITKYIH